jgi:FKBP12-rapamycin complex-associated protein
MIAALEPLHEELERVGPYSEALIDWLLTYQHQGPQTARETSFIQAFGRELHEAREATRRYQKYGEIKDLDNAWDIYFAVRKVVFHPPFIMFTIPQRSLRRLRNNCRN